MTLATAILSGEQKENSTATSLIKKDFLPLDTARPIPVMTDHLANQEEISCPHCPQRYTLGFSQGEQFQLNRWRIRATEAISRSQEDGPAWIVRNVPGVR